MVILKNSFAAGMLDAALLDQRLNLPRWMLLDNVEDKGMVEERSWNFQRLLAAMSEAARRSEEHTSELQSLMRISYAVFCLKKKKKTQYRGRQYITTGYNGL